MFSTTLSSPPRPPRPRAPLEPRVPVVPPLVVGGSEPPRVDPPRVVGVEALALVAPAFAPLKN